jgi:S1-C subfamily serine protease
MPLRLIIIVSALLTSLPAFPAELTREVAAMVRRAAVEIHIGGQLRGGGAFVKNIKGKPFVITAAHLFPNPRVTCFVRTEDDKAHFASLTGYDLGHDLALLEVDPASIKPYVTLSVAANPPSETKPVFNFGPALNRRTLVIPGNVADARVSFTDFFKSQGYIQHWFVSGINPALTSGGIWVNRSGEIVGIQHGRLIGDQGAPSSGLSMASPPKAIRQLISKRGIAKTSGLGGYVWESWTADEALLNKLPQGMAGLIVSTVIKNRPLARAGIKQLDIILTCDGKPTMRRHQLLEMIRKKGPESSFKLEIFPHGEHQRKTVNLVTDCLEDLWK